MPLLTRRRFATLALCTAAAGAVRPAFAAPTMEPYSEAAYEAATKRDAPVYLHVYAPWCLQCHEQDVVLQRLMAKQKYAAATFLRVSYDTQEKVAQALNVPRATLIAYRRDRETGRVSGSAAQADLEKVLNSAL